MPGLSGMELLKRIRQTDKTRDVPVVVLTGLSDTDLKERALRRGADRFAEQAGRRRPVDRPAAKRVAGQELPGRSAVANKLLTEKVQRQSVDWRNRG